MCPLFTSKQKHDNDKHAVFYLTESAIVTIVSPLMGLPLIFRVINDLFVANVVAMASATSSVMVLLTIESHFNLLLSLKAVNSVFAAMEDNEVLLMPSSISIEEGWVNIVYSSPFSPTVSLPLIDNAFALQLRTMSLMNEEDDLVRPLLLNHKILMVMLAWLKCF